MKNKFEYFLAQCPIIAILRGITPNNCIDIAEILYQSGVKIIEVPLNSPDPFSSIKRLKMHFQDNAIIGAGTVLQTDDVIKVKEANGEIIIAPNLDLEVGNQAKQLDMLWLPGVITPTEGFLALKCGADGLKLFPSEMITPQVLKAWKSVFPLETKLFPVGGVDAHNAEVFLQNGATGLGIGGTIFKIGYSSETVRIKITEIIRTLSS